ncbi:DUF1569 domain-containing protein [Stieleria sp. TO1_6]|uniref:DUF1569 domain-containing protein n=1 Tax=Stieleria tagensis TaxID=2956795 RepID=UPI00209B5C13|nr:DUF1569 domain-containing protein [Stieleria tagensis]MCO8123066.1 DUF1569 domain-containing protein [Stieleria tagensis]
MPRPKKRILDFHTGEDVIAEINRLRQDGYRKTKNWNLTQACEHLNLTMTGGMEGFGFRLPWILRATVIKWVINRIFRTRKMSSAPTIDRLKPKTEDGPDDDGVIDDCIATIRQAERFDGSLEDYPFLDNLKPDDWRQFMWIHAAHHLGFFVANGEETRLPV